MKRTLLLSALALSLAASPALAEGKKGKHPGKSGHGHSAQFCPPGLAKKGNGCQPPGQARKQAAEPAPVYRVEPAPLGDRTAVAVPVYRVGEYIQGDHVVIRDPSPYGLDPRYTYWRVGNEVFRVDADTGRVLSTLGAIAAVLE